MKKKIFLSMVSVAMAVLILIITASLTVYYNFFQSQVKSDIQKQTTIVKQGYENATDKLAFLNGVFVGNTIRVTIIEPDGNVSFDTYADSDSLRDHLDREEIKEAALSGEGESVRFSQTLKTTTYYYAVRLNDNNIVRLSGSINSIKTVFFSMLPFIIMLAVLVFIACLFISKLLTNRIVNPLQRLGDNLEMLDDNDNYDELNPFVEKIAKQNATILKQVDKLKAERDTITLITDHMNEGLVLLGKDRYILSVNKGAIAFLNAHVMDFVGQNLIVLTREASLLRATDKALEGISSDGIIAIGDKSYQYFANPVYESEQVNGAILFLLDVTQRQKVERMRQEFSANVSHELKTPLTTISGFAEMIENDMVKSQADLINFAGLIHKESGRLLTLIDDIMRISQMEGHVETNMEQVDLDIVARNVYRSLQYKATEKKVALRLESEYCIVMGNPGMFEELIYNLTENAIKYNVIDGEVTIRIKRDGKKGIITVSDTGIGIPKEDHDRVFERFYRVDKSRSKQTGGTGLGLSIVKHIVEFHGASLEFDSEVGKGTSIKVTI